MKIFVCEDDQRQREHMVSIIKNYIMIEEKPMELALATNDPYEVLEQSKELNDIGCYFLDIQLEADMNGIKLASEIRKHDPVGNIIFVTSHSELTYLTFVYKVAAMDFIFKDDPSELKMRIIDCLETAHTRLKLLSKESNVDTIELKREVIQYTFNMMILCFLNHLRNLIDSLHILIIDKLNFMET